MLVPMKLISSCYLYLIWPLHSDGFNFLQNNSQNIFSGHFIASDFSHNLCVGGIHTFRTVSAVGGISDFMERSVDAVKEKQYA
jgi:hypothetical protein